MPLQRFDVLTGIGTLASSAIAIYGWLYSIGLAQLFMFIAGAGFTMLNQERIENKRQQRERQRRMSELVYGPLHGELNSILKNLEGFQPATGTSLYGITKSWRFNLDDIIRKKLGPRIEKFRKRLVPCADLCIHAKRETETHILKEFGKHKITKGVRFEVWLGDHMILSPSITDIIFSDKTPLEYIAERVSSYATPIVHVNSKSEGKLSSEHRIQQISMDILLKVRENPTIQEYRREREDVIKECNSIIESTEKQIVL